MRKYLLPEKGNFYKANLHCHTNISDGRLSPEEVKATYMDLGYSVVAYTDHNILVPHNELTDETFVALNGVELSVVEERDDIIIHKRKVCHMNLIGLTPETITQPFWHRTKYLDGKNAMKNRHLVKWDTSLPDYERQHSGEGISEIMNGAREKGFYVIYNHPTWALENYDNYMKYTGMHAVEMFNGNCLTKGFEEENGRVYDDMLRGGKRIFCVGSDDNHNGHPKGSRRYDSGVAFTMIRAESLSYQSITEALLRGDFYASEGPEIYSLWYEDGEVHITCSDADRIYCTFDMRNKSIAHMETEPLRAASFVLPEGYGYFRITVVDRTGKKACTNAYFAEALQGFDETAQMR